jgi:hypothetical protein
MALQIETVSNLRQYNMVINSAGLGAENDFTANCQQEL